MLGEKFHRLPGEFEMPLNRHVGIVHGAGADRAADAFSGEFICEAFDGVGFDEDVLVEGFDLVA